MSMDDLATLLGYSLMAIAGVLAVVCGASLAFGQVWEKISEGKNLSWLGRAIAHYKKIEPCPTKERS